MRPYGLPLLLLAFSAGCSSEPEPLEPVEPVPVELFSISPAEGYANGYGTPVVVSGKGFVGIVTVYIDGKLAPPSDYVTASKLNTTIYGGIPSDSLDITVRNGTGQSFTLKNAFVVHRELLRCVPNPWAWEETCDWVP